MKARERAGLIMQDIVPPTYPKYYCPRARRVYLGQPLAAMFRFTRRRANDVQLFGYRDELDADEKHAIHLRSTINASTGATKLVDTSLLVT